MASRFREPFVPLRILVSIERRSAPRLPECLSCQFVHDSLVAFVKVALGLRLLLGRRVSWIHDHILRRWQVLGVAGRMDPFVPDVGRPAGSIEIEELSPVIRSTLKANGPGVRFKAGTLRKHERPLCEMIRRAGLLPEFRRGSGLRCVNWDRAHVARVLVHKPRSSRS